MQRVWIVLFCVLISPLVLGQDDPVDYRADDIYFRVDSTVGYLTGNAWVKSGSMTLTAHRIVLRLDDDEVCALGRATALGPGSVGLSLKTTGSRSARTNCATTSARAKA